ncbi:unnamed protein product, partial [Tetraodon nigroviridis]
RTISQHLNDLKKENFSLKLRIYFLEEKIQQKFEQSDDDVHRTNIELKVQVESLKKELEENQQLLAPTPSAEQLSDQNAAELQRHLAERQQEISHVQEVLETKVQLLQQEAELARAEAQHMASLADSEAQRRQALERELVEKTEESKDQGLKDRLMEELREQKHDLDLQVEELRARVLRLSSALAQRHQEVEVSAEDEGGVQDLWPPALRQPAALDLPPGGPGQPAGAAVPRSGPPAQPRRPRRVRLLQMRLPVGSHVPLRRGHRPRGGAVPGAPPQAAAGAGPAPPGHRGPVPEEQPGGRRRAARRARGQGGGARGRGCVRILGPGPGGLTLSVHESWADAEPEQHQHLLPCPEARPRRCRGCAALRVADSDYEAVCRVPRRLGRRSTSCGPSSRCSDPSPGAQDPVQTPGASDATDSTLEPSCSALDTQRSPCGGTGTSPSPASSLESLDLTVGTGAPPADHEEDRREEPEEDKAQSPLCGPETLLDPLRGCEYRPPKLQGPSRIPVLLRAKVDQDLAPAPLWSGEGPADLVPQRDLRAELVEMQEDWEDHYGSWEAQEPLVTSDLSHERLRGQEPQKNQEQVRSLQARNQAAELLSGHRGAECAAVLPRRSRPPLPAAGVRSGGGGPDPAGVPLPGPAGAAGRPAGARRAARTQQDLQRALQRLEADLQGALQHRRTTERHNQELRRALEELRPALLEAQRCQAEQEQERRRGGEEQEATIRQLRSSLLARDQLIEVSPAFETRDRLLQKLRLRVRERDRALQRAVDDKFDYVKEKEEESRRLQRLVGEAEREAARQRAVLADNQESIAVGHHTHTHTQRWQAWLLTAACVCVCVCVSGPAAAPEGQVSGAAAAAGVLPEAPAAAAGQRAQARARPEGARRRHQPAAGGAADPRRGEPGRPGGRSRRGQEGGQGGRSGDAPHHPHILFLLLQVLRSSLLLPSAPSSVLEELKLRLQLKDRLFQEVLADRTQQAQEHQEQVQELLGTLRSRDQYIQVMEEQSSRLQELSQQLSWSRGGTSEQEELQALKEELQVALRRSKENQELSRSQAATLESLSRRLHLKEEQIRDLRRTTEEPSHLPLVERLTQEVRELQESRAQQGGAAARGRERPGGGDTNTEEEDADEDESRLSVQMKEQRNPEPEGGRLTLLLQQKMLVETELWELKAQLEQAGFTSLNALLSVRAENTHLRQQLQPDQLEDEAALDGTIEGEDEEEEEIAEMWDTWHGQISLCHHEETLPSSSSLVGGAPEQPKVQTQPVSEPGVSACLQVDAGVFAVLQPKSRDLQEPPTLPLARTAVQQDSKLVQVDLQDLGYETCGRSENEAERADTSSPEFDDLQMCTSLACGSQGWPSGAGSTSQTDQGPLRRLVDGLQAQLGSPVLLQGPGSLIGTEVKLVSGGGRGLAVVLRCSAGFAASPSPRPGTCRSWCPAWTRWRSTLRDGGQEATVGRTGSAPPGQEPGPGAVPPAPAPAGGWGGVPRPGPAPGGHHQGLRGDCCAPTTSTSTWARASGSSWPRAPPWCSASAPRSAAVSLKAPPRPGEGTDAEN